MLFWISKVELLVQKKFSAKSKWLLDKAFELAAGIYILDERDPSKTKYYKKPPDLDAIIYLIDRVLGKPVAKQENFQNQAKKGVAELQNIIQVLAGGQININICHPLQMVYKHQLDLEQGVGLSLCFRNFDRVCYFAYFLILNYCCPVKIKSL